MHTQRWLLLFVLLALAPFAWPLPPVPQIAIVPGSSSRGAELFQRKGCVHCHAFNGEGGNGAPDLAQRSERAYTPALLASVLWNHSPAMWSAQNAGQIRPMLSSAETADLFAYFYSLLYFSIPGDASRGKLVFEQKNCARCHAKTNIGPPISAWAEVKDPISWAERMWNHSGKMYTEMSRIDIPWPRFTTQNMVDLLVYLRNLPAARSHSATFRPGDPEKGRRTFERSCESCHSFGARTAEHKIDLLKMRAVRTLTGYVTAMWNHAPLMRKRAGNNFPTLNFDEMSDLVAYLFAQRYFYEEGNVSRGAHVFESKKCVVCHEQRRQETRAPDLSMAAERYSPITMSTAIWRHGPAMLEMMKKEKLPWPQFTGPEMANLIAYLNSRLIPRAAN